MHSVQWCDDSFNRFLWNIASLTVCVVAGVEFYREENTTKFY